MAQTAISQSRRRMRDAYGQTLTNVFTDFDWICRNEIQLIEQFGECSILVYQQQVIGVGDSYEEALSDAELHLPKGNGEITPVYQQLRQRHPSLRLQLTPTSAKSS